MIQLRLTNCVQNGGTILTCLEGIYVSERRGFILNEVQTQAQTTRKQTLFRPAQINKKIILVPPTDDPKLVEEFYKRRSKVVNEYPYKYVLTPKRSCNNDTYMVILVHSFHPYDDRRHAIRSTWGGAAVGRHHWPRENITRKVKLFFMLGTHPLTKMNSAIRKESEKYDDIIQGNFFDAYVNMTLKSLLGLKYMSDYCKHAQYLLKSDDDMIVNMPYLLDILQEKNITRSIMGPLNRGSKVFRAGKWKVSLTDFPFRIYPAYESGSAYVITNDLVSDLYNTSHYVRHFHVDDAYITGILGKIIGVNHQEQKGFAFWTDKAPVLCDIINNIKISGTKMTPKKLEDFWKKLHQDHTCSRRIQ
jgi:hypothetical protein